MEHAADRMFFFVPLGHDRRHGRPPLATVGLIVACVLVALWTGPRVEATDRAFEDAAARVEAILDEHPEAGVPRSVIDDFPVELPDSLVEELVDDGAAEHPSDADAELADALDALGAALVERPAFRYGYRPTAPSLTTLWTSMWMHDGWMHLVGNMVYLFVAGSLLERRWSAAGLVAFYTCAGVAATLAQHCVSFASGRPMVGASGAIAGLLGAALVLDPMARIRFGYWLVVRFGTFRLPAWVPLPAWIAWQIVLGRVERDEGGVALFAHIGGFAFGLAAALALHHRPRLAPAVRPPEHPDRGDA